jgi:hypothetical protein
MVKVGRKKPGHPKTSGVLGRIQDVADAEDEGLTVSLYGQSGSGKTTTASTFRKPLLHIDCAGGIKSIKGVKGINTIKLEHPDEVDELTEHQEKSGKYKTVVLDHSTKFQEMVLQMVIGVDELPKQLSWGVANQQQWGSVALGMKTKIGRMLALSKQGTDVIIVSQQREFIPNEDSDILDPYVSCALTQGTAGWLNYECDYVIQQFRRMHAKRIPKKVGRKTVYKKGPEELQYCLRLQPHPVYASKFRATKGTKYPEVMIDPSYSKLIKIINAEED